MKQSGSHGFMPLLVVLFSLILVTATFGFGYLVGHKNLVFSEGYKPAIISKELGKPKDIDFNLFWNVWDRVSNKFAGTIDSQKMLYGAINGALSSLDDPYTLFMPPTEAKQFNEDLQGQFDGIGAEIEKRDNLITVVAPLKDSPAEKAGLKAKDVIVKIDDDSTENLGLQEAISKIRGKKGTVVRLGIVRDAGEVQEFKVTRDTITVKSVTWEVKNDKTGYIKISEFGEDTTDLLNKAIDELTAKKVSSLVVDLRNNPGGYLDAAVDMTSLFLKDRGVIVKQKDKDGTVTELKATDAARMTDIPMVILINGGSASASEIFSGALQDYGRAKLIGETSYGKGSVQELESLPGGGAVRITIAKWLTPKDRQINKVGIKPDIEVVLSEDDAKANRDPQLDRALQEVSK